MTTPSFFLLENMTSGLRGKPRPELGLPRNGVTLVDPTARPGVQLARVLETELFLYARAVGLDRGGTYAQPDPDLAGCPAFANQLEDGELAIGQALDRSR